jgi:hypothetical protein
MNTICIEKIELTTKCNYLYQLAEKVESDKLVYSMSYDLMNEGKIILVELIGDGSSKLIRINLNTNNGIIMGEFTTNTALSNIYFLVERIRFYSEFDISFYITLFKK